MQVVDGLPVRVWTFRAWTAEELLAQQEAANAEVVRTDLEPKLTNMQAILDQTNADIRTDPSQEIKDPARAVRLLIRMSLGKYDAAD